MSLRNERVRKALMREISDIIFREIKDPQICGMVSITDVDVSSDNSAARVFYSVYGDDEVKEKTSKALERHVGQIRHEVGKRIRLRVTPEIKFVYSDGLEKGSRVLDLIDKISKGEIK